MSELSNVFEPKSRSWADRAISECFSELELELCGGVSGGGFDALSILGGRSGPKTNFFFLIIFF